MSKPNAKPTVIWPEMNKSEESIDCDFHSCCTNANLASAPPIDEFYSYARELLVRSGRPEISADSVFLRLLLLEVVSGAEYYFRRVLTELLIACPLSRTAAGAKVLPLSAISYYDKPLIGFGVLEGLSLAGKGEIKKQTMAMTGLEIKNGSSEFVALEDFEKICHIRHAIVHAKGQLGSHNAIELGLASSSPRRIEFDSINFQKLVAKTQNAVRAYNRFLFRASLERWIKEDKLTGNWPEDEPIFRPLHALLYSKMDAIGSATAEQAHAGITGMIKRKV